MSSTSQGDEVPVRPVLLAAAMGTTWTLAIACMAYGMGVLKLPVSIIAPLTNSNALIAVLVGAVVFSEWRNLNLSLVALGTLLICAGATVIPSRVEHFHQFLAAGAATGFWSGHQASDGAGNGSHQRLAASARQTMVEHSAEAVPKAGLWRRMARPKRFELLTPRFVVWCSIQLSYGRVFACAFGPYGPGCVRTRSGRSRKSALATCSGPALQGGENGFCQPRRREFCLSHSGARGRAHPESPCIYIEIPGSSLRDAPE